MIKLSSQNLKLRVEAAAPNGRGVQEAQKFRQCATVCCYAVDFSWGSCALPPSPRPSPSHCRQLLCAFLTCLVADIWIVTHRHVVLGPQSKLHTLLKLPTLKILRNPPHRAAPSRTRKVGTCPGQGATVTMPRSCEDLHTR